MKADSRTRVLVTGGSGFLGSHVVDALVEAGYDVLVFDIRPSSNGYFVKGDLTSLDDTLQATQGIDYVCHLGAVGDVYLAGEKPALATAVNVLGTANLMEACLRNGVKKVVYASTWEVYGEAHYQPVDEDHPCAPDHPYSITKLAGEQLALAYDHLRGLPVLSLRLGTAYGTRMRPNAVFSIFINRALKKEPLIIKGSGKQSRQFTHTSDIARAFLSALNHSLHGEKLNIVAKESTSIKRLAELITQRLPTTISYESARAGDPPSLTVACEQAQKLLGWQAKMSFQEGLSQLIDHYQRQAAQPG